MASGELQCMFWEDVYRIDHIVFEMVLTAEHEIQGEDFILHFYNIVHSSVYSLVNKK